MVREIIALLTAFGCPFQPLFRNLAGRAVNATAKSALDVLGRKSAMMQQRSADRSLMPGEEMGKVLRRLCLPGKSILRGLG